MQQFHLHYDQAVRLFPGGWLPMSLLATAAVLLLYYGHWMLLILAVCLGLSLLHRLQCIEQASSGSVPESARLESVDGGLSSGQPSVAQPTTGSAVVSDGGSFERSR